MFTKWTHICRNSLCSIAQHTKVVLAPYASACVALLIGFLNFSSVVSTSSRRFRKLTRKAIRQRSILVVRKPSRRLENPEHGCRLSGSLHTGQPTIESSQSSKPAFRCRSCSAVSFLDRLRKSYTSGSASPSISVRLQRERKNSAALTWPGEFWSISSVFISGSGISYWSRHICVDTSWAKLDLLRSRFSRKI